MISKVQNILFISMIAAYLFSGQAFAQKTVGLSKHANILRSEIFCPAERLILSTFLTIAYKSQAVRCHLQIVAILFLSHFGDRLELPDTNSNTIQAENWLRPMFLAKEA